MFSPRSYNDYIAYADEQQQKRMGYPLTGVVHGFFNQSTWVRTNNRQQPLLDMSDMGLTLQSGDYHDAKYW